MLVTCDMVKRTCLHRKTQILFQGKQREVLRAGPGGVGTGELSATGQRASPAPHLRKSRDLALVVQAKSEPA